MGKVRCEICGSTNITKVNDEFVCDECGMKYSLDEAKLLLTEEDQLDDVIDIENSKDEIRNSFNDVETTLNSVNNILFSITEIFVSYPCKKYEDYIIDQFDKAVELLLSMNDIAKDRFYHLDIGTSFVELFKSQMIKAYENITYEYGSNKKEMDKDSYSIYTTRFESIISLGYKLISKPMHESSLNSLQKLLSEYIKTYLHSCSYFVTKSGRIEVNTTISGEKREVMDGFNSDINISVPKIKKELISLEEELRVLKVKHYWEDHPEEKQKLDEEKLDYENGIKEREDKINDLNNQISALKNSAPVIEELPELEEARQELKELQNKKKALGLFNFKEKKQWDAPIANAEKKVNSLNTIVTQKKQLYWNDIDSKIRPLNASIKETVKEIEGLKKNIEIVSKKLDRKA